MKLSIFLIHELGSTQLASEKILIHKNTRIEPHLFVMLAAQFL
jgi:hypothetical protein